jgi:hypothetical protein
MAMPLLTRIDYRVMKVAWQPLNDVVSKGGSDVKYILFWDKGDPLGKVDKAITITTALEHTVEIMEPGKDYRFIVQA